MNLDEYKPLAKQITAPASAPSADPNLGHFIADLRLRDQQERRRLLGLALTYLSLGLLLATGMTWQSGRASIGCGILLVALYAALEARWFGRVNYTASTLEFLTAASKRYRFLRAGQAVYLVPLWLVLAYGGGIMVWETAQKYLSPEGCLRTLIGYGVFLAALTLFGLVQGRRSWRKDKAAVLGEILKRRQELQNG